MKFGVFFIVLLILFDKSSVSASASSSLSPARIVSGFFSNAVSALLKWVWSLKSTTKTAVSSRPMMRFESGYTVETVFDGSKLGIEPYAVEIAPTGDLLVLDSVNSNIYRIPPSLSRYTRPKLVAGSAEGYTGHVDGKPRDARMNRPKALTVDDRGNIYVADTVNMVVRKISDTGVTTIAGGKWNRGGHSDGPSEDAKFSDDFEVVYIGSSCSLLIVDRGNQAIREIQLNFDDCAYQYGSSFPLGVALLIGAAFFGYMLALLQRRLMAYSDNEDKLQQQLMTTPMMKTNFQPSNPTPPYQKPPKSTVRPPLIPSEDEPEKHEEDDGLFSSVGKLFTGAGSFVSDLFGASRKKSNNNQHQQYTNQTQYLQHQQQQQWPVQDSYVIPNDEPPPPLETRTPTPRKTYAFMAKDAEKIHQLRHGRSYFNSWDGDLSQPQQIKQQIQQQMKKQQHLQQQRHYSLGPQTYYEQSCESTNEIVFGAVQESDKMRASMEIKAVNYGNSLYDQGAQHNLLRPRISHGGGGSGYNNRHPY